MSTSIKAAFPGSFDPFTLGHLEIARRAKEIFGNLTLLVCEKPSKNTMFSVSERLAFAEESLARFDIPVMAYEGLLAQTLTKENFTIVVRGIRGSEDILSELSMAHYNREFSEQVETLFLPTSAELRFVSSSAAREVVKYARTPDNLKNLLPESVINRVCLN